MPSDNLIELKEVLKDTLASRGVLDNIKAKIRAEIFQAIEDKSVPKPMLTNENVLINELIREYLEYNNYHNTLSVFLPETGQPKTTSFTRTFLQQQLNVQDNNTQVPLLYGLTNQS